MRDLLRELARALRADGFRGSGQTYRRTDEHIIVIVNVQKSRWDARFYVNLGAEPRRTTDVARLHHYDCLLRRRVGDDWPVDLADAGLAEVIARVRADAWAFVAWVERLRNAVATEPVERAVAMFATDARQRADTARWLAEVATRFGDADRAATFAQLADGN